MPKFTIGVIRRQTLEERAEVEVEAESAEAAARQVAATHEADTRETFLAFGEEELVDCQIVYGTRDDESGIWRELDAFEVPGGTP